MLTIDSPIHGTRIAELLLPVSLRFSLDGKLQRGGWGERCRIKNVYRHVLEYKTAQVNQIANRYFERICSILD